MISQPKLVAKRDPFYIDPPPKAHYFPTEKKKLSDGQKKTAISPSRSGTSKRYEEERLSYNDELFLKGGNAFTSGVNQDKNDSGSSKFDESWPSTDRPLSTTEDDHPLNDIIFQRSGDRFVDLKKTLEFPERDNPLRKDLISENGNMRQDSSSTLQKYIERFRSGQPMSREERQKAAASSQKDFWWLSERSLTDSSTPKDDSPGAKRTKRFTPHSPISPYKSNTDKKLTSQMLAAHSLDDTTKLLQEKADRLLDSASSVASSDPIVSTDGLGSSQSFSTTVSSVEEQPYRPSFARKFDKQDKYSYQIPKTQGRQPSRPEEDVLYQWRLKRRMEQARDNAARTPAAVKFGYKEKSQEQRGIDQKLEEFKQKLSGRSVPQVSLSDDLDDGRTTETPLHVSHGSVQFTPAPSAQPKVNTETHVSSQRDFPIASPSLPQTTGADKIKPHFHLRCDLLPCSHQNHKIGHETHTKSEGENYLNEKKFKGDKPIFSEAVNKGGNSSLAFDNQVISNNKEEITDSDRYKFLQAERPDIENKEKVETESGTEDHTCDTKYVIENEDKINKQRQIKSQEKQNKENNEQSNKTKSGNQKKVNKTDSNSIPELKPSGRPKPAVDSAIGQVIKDRLFNISTSTVLSSIDSDVSSPQQPKYTEKRHCQADHNNTEDNYESDGEFPEDELLHMLRQQRVQYEVQLRQIDEMLAKLEPEDS